MNESNIVVWEKRVWSHSDPQGENGLCSKWRGRWSLASGSIRRIDRPEVYSVGFV
jgi:hypothetical protein